MSASPALKTGPIPGLLKDKVVIVTGASRGIGAAAARTFSGAGAAVVPAARSDEASGKLADEIERQARSLAVLTDVGDPASVERLVQKVME